MYSLLYLLPRTYVSHFIGLLAWIPVPSFLKPIVFNFFVNTAGIDMSVASKELYEYRSVQDVFTRDLKQGIRPIEEGFVSPVDGTLMRIQTISKGQVEQVKGRPYSLLELLGDIEVEKKFEGGTLFHYYLSPKDYHHVHSPVDGNIVRTRYLPGTLWPVNHWSLVNIKDLFIKNDRIVSYINSERGPVIVVFVGATNVGAIKLTYDQTISGNKGQSGKVDKMYTNPISVKKGEKLGSFFLGSTVLVLVPKGYTDPCVSTPDLPVHYGMQIGMD